MKHLWTLVKVDFIHNYSINRLRKRHGPRTSLTPLIMMLLTYLGLVLIIVPAIIGLTYILHQNGFSDYILYLGILVGNLITFIFTITKINNVLFESKDFDLLVNLPIKTRTIILSKIISLSLITYLYFLLIFAPFIITFGILMKYSILYYMSSIIVFICSPLLIIAICGLLTYLFSFTFRRRKNKSLIRSIIGISALTVFLIFYFLFANGLIDFEKNSQEILEILKVVLYFIVLAVEGMTTNILSLFFYFCLCFISFGLLVVIVDKNYLKANMRAKMTYQAKEYKAISKNVKKQYQSLLLKESKRFFASSTYFMNVIVGPILAVISVVITYFSITSLSNEPIDKNFILPMLLFSSCLMFGIMPSTAASINMEGKTFWIIKSLPIKTKDLFLAKISFYVFLCTPFILMNSIFCAIMIKSSISDKIIYCLTQFVLVTFYAVQGLWMNILTPKFDWTSEIKAIKQSAGTIYTVLINMVTSLIIFVPSFVLMAFEYNSLYVTFILAILLLWLMSHILATHGKNKYHKIIG